MWEFTRITYLAIVGLATLAGLIQYKKMDRASKILIWYLVVTLISEAIAIYAAIIYKNNLLVYHVYSPIQFALLTAYFNLSKDQKKITKAGWVIGLSGIILSILNSIYLQPPAKELNTNFIILEAFLVIGMSLFAFYRLLASDIIYIHLSPKFWFSSIFLVFWSFTFFYWLVSDIIYKSMPDKSVWLNNMLIAINIIVYSTFTAVFLSYKKMKPV